MNFDFTKWGKGKAVSIPPFLCNHNRSVVVLPEHIGKQVLKRRKDYTRVDGYFEYTNANSG